MADESSIEAHMDVVPEHPSRFSFILLGI